MAKLYFLLSILFISASSWAGLPVPSGTYSGKGKLIRYADGSSFSYDVKYIIGTNSVTAQYVYPNGMSYTLPFTTTDTSYGQFNVYIQGQQAGAGYCIGISCHVTVSFPLNGVLQTDSLEFTSVFGFIVISGKNATTNTSFEDVVHK